MNQLMDQVDEAMTVIETMKKIPEYNADLTVMMATHTARLKVLISDPRCDDIHLVDKDAGEPIPITIDNYMKEGIKNF